MHDYHKKYEFNKGQIESIPEEKGIYAFWIKRQLDKRWQCIYVGKGENIKSRIKGHWNNRSSSGDDFNKHKSAFGHHYYFCYHIIRADNIDKLENKLIKYWRPFTNQQGTK